MNFRQPFRGEWPISQRYGEKITDPKGHTGIDYACPVSTPILASADGTVMFAGWDTTGFGRCVIIRHDGSHSTLYAHLALLPRGITAGVDVKQGEEIGFSGSTGNSTGPHLHFEARKVWNDYKSHFDPMSLPLMSMDDTVTTWQKDAQASQKLKEPEDLPDLVEVVCPDGAKVFNPDWSMRYAGFPQGTPLHFTGRTTKRLGYTYCEVYPEPAKYWVAVHDGETQILA